MHLNQAQQDILFCIRAKPEISKRFDTFCAILEGHLDEVERPDLEKTDPHGIPSIPVEPVDSETAAEVIAVAWLEMMARAIMDQDEVNALLFDEDGLAVFSDISSVFEVVRACGIAPAAARRAFRRTRGDAPVVPSGAMRILGSIGAIQVPKRKSLFRGASRVHELSPRSAAGLDKGEIARAKAGNIVYALVTRPDGYSAVRMRKVRAPLITDTADAPPEVLTEPDVDEMTGFYVPLIPHPAAHAVAIGQFVEFLDREDEKKRRNTYHRLVHRPLAA
jgi:hypothetical protein